MLAFLAAPMGAAYHLVFALAAVLAPLTGGAATAAAIVVFTIAVRLLLFPLSYYSIRGQAAISALHERVQELRRRYARQPDRLQRELAGLYRQEGTGLLAGCLALFVQLPFFSVMYRLFLSPTVAGQPNGLLHRSLFASPLGSRWLSFPGPLSLHGLLFVCLFGLLAVVGLAGARLANTDAVEGGPPAGPLAILSRLLPCCTVVIAAFVPLAAVVYLVTTASWSAAERAIMQHWLLRRPTREASVTTIGERGPTSDGR